MQPRVSLATRSRVKLCVGMMKKLLSGFAAMLVGIAQIIIGELFFVQPGILAWLAGATLVLIGIMLLMMARIVSGMGAQLRGR